MEDQKVDTKGQEISLKESSIFLPDELKGGVFSNNVFISHTPEEFIFDFLSVLPTIGSVVSRVIMTPSHTKRFVKVLTENLKIYEDKFGEVPEKIEQKKGK